MQAVVRTLRHELGVHTVESLAWVPVLSLAASSLPAAAKQHCFVAAATFRAAAKKAMSVAVVTESITTVLGATWMRMSEGQIEQLMALGVRKLEDLACVRVHEWESLGLSPTQLGQLVALKRWLFPPPTGMGDTHIVGEGATSGYHPNANVVAGPRTVRLPNNDDRSADATKATVLHSAHWWRFRTRYLKFANAPPSSVCLLDRLCLTPTVTTATTTTTTATQPATTATATPAHRSLLRSFRRFIRAIAQLQALYQRQPRRRRRSVEAGRVRAEVVFALLQFAGGRVAVRTLDLIWSACTGDVPLCNSREAQVLGWPALFVARDDSGRASYKIEAAGNGDATATTDDANTEPPLQRGQGVSARKQAEDDEEVQQQAQDGDDEDEDGDSDGERQEEEEHEQQPLMPEFMTWLMTRTDVKHARFDSQELLGLLPRPDKFARAMENYFSRCATLRLIDEQVRVQLLTACVRVRGIAKSLVVPTQLVRQFGIGLGDHDHSDDDDDVEAAAAATGGKAGVHDVALRRVQATLQAQWANSHAGDWHVRDVVGSRQGKGGSSWARKAASTRGKVMLVGNGAKQAQAAFYRAWAIAERIAAERLRRLVWPYYSPWLSRLMPRRHALAAHHSHHHSHHHRHQQAITNVDAGATSVAMTVTYLEVVVGDVYVNMSVAELESILSWTVTAQNPTSNSTTTSTTNNTVVDNEHPGTTDTANAVEQNASASGTQSSQSAHDQQQQQQQQQAASRRQSLRRRSVSASGSVGSRRSSSDEKRTRCWFKLPKAYQRLLSIELWCGRACIGRFEMVEQHTGPEVSASGSG